MNEAFQTLKDIFDRDVCQRATAPLKDGIEIAVEVRSLPVSSLCLRREEGRLLTLERAAKNPDMTFDVTLKSLQTLQQFRSEDIGEVGVEILKLMASSDEELKIRARVHIGAFNLFRNGYLGVLPLGGPAVMKFLGTKGLTSIGKIKEALSKLKG